MYDILERIEKRQDGLVFYETSGILTAWKDTQHRRVEQLVARWTHNPKVGGSNPSPATKVRPFAYNLHLSVTLASVIRIDAKLGNGLSELRLIFNLVNYRKTGDPERRIIFLK